jgi:hypothetical protein
MTRLVLGFSLAMPLVASAADPSFLRLAQAASRDGGFEDCANACQLQVDQRIAQCPGFREIANPALAATPAAPRCKQTAVEQYQGCLSRCPAPRYAPQG